MMLWRHIWSEISLMKAVLGNKPWGKVHSVNFIQAIWWSHLPREAAVLQLPMCFLYSLKPPWLWALCIISVSTLCPFHCKHSQWIKIDLQGGTNKASGQLSQTYWLLVIHFLTETVPGVQCAPRGPSQTLHMLREQACLTVRRAKMLQGSVFLKLERRDILFGRCVRFRRM